MPRTWSTSTHWWSEGSSTPFAPGRTSTRSSRSSIDFRPSIRAPSAAEWRRPSLADSGFGKREQLPPQLLDFVAQLRRVLEPELLGGGEHLLFERDDQALELVAAHPLDLALAATAARRDVRLLERQELGDVGHALDDRLRRDPVLLVVGKLLLATPRCLVHRLLDRLGQLVGVEDHLAVDVPR